MTSGGGGATAARPTAGRVAVDRRADRLVATTAMVIAVAFLCAAVVVALLPDAQRYGPWLPLHLVMAGGASSAIAGVMPFFSAAIAAAQPVAARLRWSSLAAVAIGALAVTFGQASSATALSTAGGASFVAGAALTAYATAAPVRRSLGPKGGVVTLGYLAALGMVTAGALLATLFLAGLPTVVAAWGDLRPAHAWLNLVGFVSLVIATTLLHFFPTVVGARIVRSPAAHLTVAGLACGAAGVAVGFWLRADGLVRGGAIATAVGALALAAYAAQVWRRRARWSGDRGWHRFASAGLISAMAWFELGILFASARLVALGADRGAGMADVRSGALIMGWVGLAVLASASHLVPAVGPGDPAAHARQRRRLGQAAELRLVAANGGIAAVSMGVALDLGAAVAAGVLLASLGLAWTAALIVWALLVGLVSARRDGNLRPFDADPKP